MIDPNHPEAFCELCGCGNVIWNTPNDIWNTATNGETHRILCPRCFMKWYEIEVGRDVVWTIQPSQPLHDWPFIDVPRRYLQRTNPAAVTYPKVPSTSETDG